MSDDRAACPLCGGELTTTETRAGELSSPRRIFYISSVTWTVSCTCGWTSSAPCVWELGLDGGR